MAIGYIWLHSIWNHLVENYYIELPTRLPRSRRPPPKLYIPSTIKTFGQKRNGLASGRLAYKSMRSKILNSTVQVIDIGPTFQPNISG